MNPLLDFSGLPRFADIRIEHIAPAIDTLVAGVQTVNVIAADAAAAMPPT